mgnify:CR=1 FL=1
MFECSSGISCPKVSVALTAAGGEGVTNCATIEIDVVLGFARPGCPYH